MLKKIILATFTSSLIVSNLSADIKSTSSKLLSDMFKQEVEVLDVQKVKVLNGMNLLVVQDKKTKQMMPIFSNDAGTVLLPFTTNIITNNPEELKFEKLLEKINQNNEPIIEELKNKQHKNQFKIKTEMDKEILKLTKEYPSIVKTLQTGKNKKVTILLDPLCKYCKDKVLDNFNEYKDFNIDLVFVGLLHKDSGLRSSAILKEWNDKNSFDDKVNVIKKYFDISYKLTSDEQKNMNQDIQKFVSKLATLELSEEFDNTRFAGNYGVPYIINH